MVAMEEWGITFLASKRTSPTCVYTMYADEMLKATRSVYMVYAVEMLKATRRKEWSDRSP